MNEFVYWRDFLFYSVLFGEKSTWGVWGWGLLGWVDDKILKALSTFLARKLHVPLGLQWLHLLADVDQVVFDVLKHRHFSHNQFSQAICLQSDLIPDVGLDFVHALSDQPNLLSRWLPVVLFGERVVLLVGWNVMLLDLLAFIDTWHGSVFGKLIRYLEISLAFFYWANVLVCLR